MLYVLVPLIAVIFLTFHYVVRSEASARSKWIVGCLTVISLVAWWRFPKWDFLATILQVGISIYIILYRKLETRPRKRRET